MSIVLIQQKPEVKYHPNTFHRPEFTRMPTVMQAVAPPGYSITITSAAEPESNHTLGTVHYAGWALDFRVKDFPGTSWYYDADKKLFFCHTGFEKVARWAKMSQKALGSLYTVILEVAKAHIHTQLNP